MSEYLRTLPVAFFILVNPLCWAFALHPPAIFVLRARIGRLRRLPVACVVSIVVGWALVNAWQHSTDFLLWLLSGTGSNMPPLWQNYLFDDGGRNSFTLFFGWAYALILLVGWSPIVFAINWSRRRRLAQAAR
jgi:hypothetical protein